jgi:murein L,D-transpeptidase YcbB/YkuD
MMDQFRAALLAALMVVLGVPAVALADDDAQLRARLDALSKPEGRIIGATRIASYEFLPKLYAALGYKLAWASQTNVMALNEAIARSWEDGLLPSDFHAPTIKALTDSGAEQSNTIERDLVMSDALARLLYQLYFGKVNPNGLDPNWNFARPALSEDPAALVAEALRSEKIAALVEKARLQHPLYSALKATLQAYTQFETAGGWPEVPTGPAVKPGGKDPRIPALRARLHVTGEYQGTVDQVSDVLDEPLAQALSNFQSSHGLDGDGVLGAQTVSALNVSAHERVEQIRVNLERARWILRPLGPEMVVVNIAGFYLHLVLKGQRVWTTRVIVGKSYNKTPIFTETMKTIVFNPDWTVPRSIIRSEIFARASADPNYLAANNYYLPDGKGGSIDVPVDWSQWTAATFPYGIVQRPGPRNALGLVKFLFPNRYSVYLHDTPGRQLFAKAGRTFSHGCIRVEEPLKLAELILGDRLGWDRGKIDAVVAANKMQSVNLPIPLPVMLLYWTVDPTFDGGAHFYQDIYGRDARLLKALNAEFAP